MDTKVVDIKALDNWFIQQSKTLNKLDKLANQYGISFLQYNVLLHLKQSDGLSPTEIADCLEVSKASISRVLRALQKKELISRYYGNSADRRKILVSITVKAEEIINKLNEKMADIEF